MQQEARNTETHTRCWSQNNLRHKAVHFVSAGQLQRDEPDNTNGQEEGPTETSPVLETQKIDDPLEAIDDPCGAFFLDSTPQDVPDTGLPDPVLRADSTDSDESSEDEVVFTGRKNNMKPVVIETGKEELEEVLGSTNAERYRPPGIPQERATHRNDRFETSPAPATPAMSQGNRWPPTDEVDTLADYIANIDHDYFEDPASHPHADVQGGMSVGQASAMEEPSAPVSEHDPTHTQEISTESHQIHTANTNEAQVQSSIDGECTSRMNSRRSHLNSDSNADGAVLSRMYLDTEPEASSGVEDDNADMDFTEEVSSTAEDEKDTDDIDLLEEMAVQYSTRKKKSTPTTNQSFLSASAFADALESDPYYGFDIMDFDRPSLRNKTKGTKPPALEDLVLSDSDLDFHIQEAWQNDRKKKKTKKKEREQLRSQGLLGRNPDDADLKAKYAKGMNMEDLVTELRTFLLSPKTRLVPWGLLPPIPIPILESC